MAGLLAVVFIFSVCEIVIRVYNGSENRDRQIWVPDPYLGVVHAPNNKFLYRKRPGEESSVWHETNSLGLLGEEVQIRKPYGVTRILVLGDSFTEALQVSPYENFCALLERHLNSGNDDPSHDYEVIGAGVPGYSPISEYLYLKRELLQLNPDLIIVQLSANDVFEDHKTRAMSVLDKDGLPVMINRYFSKKYKDYPAISFEKTQKRSLFEKLHTAAISHSRYIEYMYTRAEKANEDSAHNKAMSELRQYRDEEQFFIIQEESPLFQDATFRNATWKNTRKYLLAIKSLAEEHNARLAFFYIPRMNQLGILEYGKDAPAEFRRPANRYLNDLLSKFAQQQNIGFLDMLPAFEPNKDKGLYSKEDGHLTPEGHRLLAEELSEFVQAAIGKGK
ncbi:MAG: SGNH/GDSL hydrolase family protein [Candidatus Omnitrophica bacterium]|nr:SGNH/GDSL hydrolase family protein [Candidatus Omnitrophota bacterium]